IPDAIGSINFSNASLPSLLRANSARVSSLPLPLDVKISQMTLSLPGGVRRLEDKKETGDSGKRWSFPPDKINLFRAFSLLLNGRRESLETSSSVLGLLSKKPLTPLSHRKPSTLSVHILPPALFSDSRMVISKEGFC